MMDYEQCLEKFYRALLRPGMIALDIGAHMGRHTIPMAESVTPGGRVFAVEPLENCRYSLQSELHRHRKLEKIVELEGFALGAEPGQSEYVIVENMPWFSGLRERVYDGPAELRRMPIEIRTIDTAFATLPRLDYIKIDAEGGEYHIMLGGRDTIRRHQPVVSFEFGVNSIGKYEITPLDVADLWLGLDYQLYDILGRPLSDRDAFNLSAQRQQVWDYLAVPRGAVAVHKLIERVLAPYQQNLQND